MGKAKFEKISLLGCRVDLVNLDELIQYILLIVHQRRKAIIAYVNVHALNLAYQVPWFREYINESQVAFCDGVGVKWAARFLTGKQLHRFTPPDWFGILASNCTAQGFSMFFLGTRQSVAQKAAAKLKETYPDLKIAGIHHGFFDKNVMSSENRDVIAMINTLNPDILVVGFGMPAQEKWILENWNELNVRVVISVGAFFDYLAGEVVRAPRWMTDNGLEWLGRLIIEPRRLWKRYMVGNPMFFWRIFIHHILKVPLPS